MSSATAVDRAAGGSSADALVCDTSVLASAIFGDRNGAEARDLTRSRRLVAPSLIRYEMAQVALRKCEGCSAETVTLVLRAYETSLRVPVQLLEPCWPDVVRLARAHGLSGYDASYLQLALSLRLPLATLDKQLGRVADELGIRAAPKAR